MAAKKQKARPGGDERRDSLVRAAFACLAADGFEGLRTRSVADRVGVNIATLHYYFPTKEALIGGVADFIATQFIALHAPPVVPTGSPALDRLHQEFADAHFYRTSHPDLAAVLCELQLRGRRDPAIRKIVEPLFGHWRHGIERCLATASPRACFAAISIPSGRGVFRRRHHGVGVAETFEAELDDIFAVVETWLLAPARARVRDGKRTEA
jgi:TetR/AcrR family transcriptional regulator, regulator of cefoperazone and chloramphenicol sensitivity